LRLHQLLKPGRGGGAHTHAGGAWGDLGAFPDPLSGDAQTLGFSKASMLHQVLSRGFNFLTAEPDTVFVHEVGDVLQGWLDSTAADMAALTHEAAGSGSGSYHSMVDIGNLAVLSRSSTIALFKGLSEKTLSLGWSAAERRIRPLELLPHFILVLGRPSHQGGGGRERLKQDGAGAAPLAV
jgi:hypothetical protein